MTIPSPLNVVTQPKALVSPKDPNTRTTSLEEDINCVSRSIETTRKELEDLTSWLLHQREIELENRLKSIHASKTPVGRQDNSHTTVLRNHRTSSQSIQEPQSYGEDCCEPYYPQNCHSQSHPSQSYSNWPAHTEYQEAEVGHNVQDPREKGKEMTFPIKKEDVHTTIKKPLSNTNLPFTN
jgi:hypothetical protein